MSVRSFNHGGLGWLESIRVVCKIPRQSAFLRPIARHTDHCMEMRPTVVFCSYVTYQAGRLKRFKKLKTSFFQGLAGWQASWPVSARLCLGHSRSKYTVPFFLLGSHLGFVLRVRLACPLTACISANSAGRISMKFWWGRSVDGVDSYKRSAVAQQIQLVVTFPGQCFQYLLHNWHRQSVPTVVKRTRNNVTLYSVFIVPTGTLPLPWLRFFRASSSVVRQMSGYNSQRRGTARTLHIRW